MSKKIIGNDDYSASQWTTGYMVHDKFTCLQSGTMDEFRLKCTASGYAKVAIYVSAAGSPTDLINKNDDSTAVSIGWNTISFPDTSLTKDTVYHLWATGDTTGAYAYGQTSAGFSYYKLHTYTDPPPDPAGAGWSAGSNRISMFAGWDSSIKVSSFTETVTMVDTIEKKTGKSLVDVITPVDSLVRKIGKAITEPVPIVETLNRSTKKTFIIPVPVVDSVIAVRKIYKSTTDVITPVDSIVRKTGKVLTEPVTVVDTLSKAWTLARTYLETITITDSVLKRVNGILFTFWTIIREKSATFTKIAKSSLPIWTKEKKPE